MAKQTNKNGNWMTRWISDTMQKTGEWVGNFETKEEAQAWVSRQFTFPGDRYEIEYLR